MKKLYIGIITLLTGIIIYQFLFGKLFPFSPVVLGFSRYEYTNTVIYFQKGAANDNYSGIDTLVSPVEEFHNLKFLKKPELFIFRDSISCRNHSPSKARFCTFTDRRLFISPWALNEAKTGYISLETYLKHELSHVLIFQHQGFLSHFKYPKWLLEGIAVYSSNQMGTAFYPDKKETYSYIKQGNFIPPSDFKTRREKQINLNLKYRMTFMYSEFACIVDYLVSKYGKDVFLSYMKNLLKSTNHDKVFRKIYGQDFDEFVLVFRGYASGFDFVEGPQASGYMQQGYLFLIMK